MNFLKCSYRILNESSIKYDFIRALSTTRSTNGLFYERDPKGGYKSTEKVSRTTLVRQGLKELKGEIALWTQEMKEKLEMDPIFIHRPGETDVVWKFNTQENLDKWIITSDKDHGEGYSSCSLETSPNGKGVFSGELITRVPKDGRIQRAGYCNMRSQRARKSFKRDSYLDWSNYNMLVFKVRGDGRSYMLNLATSGYFDVTWNDTFNYILFTRGGPYWQLTRIPFSKFFLSSKGRIQDKQVPIPLHRITNFGITLGDKVNGPFRLEIDYIGLEYDPAHTEDFAYEMYKTDEYITGH